MLFKCISVSINTKIAKWPWYWFRLFQIHFIELKWLYYSKFQIVNRLLIDALDTYLINSICAVIKRWLHQMDLMYFTLNMLAVGIFCCKTFFRTGWTSNIYIYICLVINVQSRVMPYFWYYCYPVDGFHANWLTDFLVTVSNTAFPVTYDQLSSFTRCGQFSGYPPASQWGRVTCLPEPVRGRYVYVSIDDITHCLVLCEVMVFGGK